MATHRFAVVSVGHTHRVKSTNTTPRPRLCFAIHTKAISVAPQTRLAVPRIAQTKPVPSPLTSVAHAECTLRMTSFLQTRTGTQIPTCRSATQGNYVTLTDGETPHGWGMEQSRPAFGEKRHVSTHTGNCPTMQLGKTGAAHVQMLDAQQANPFAC